VLLVGGIDVSPGPIIVTSNLQVTNAIVATFTITDQATGGPASKWKAKIDWGDGSLVDKQVPETTVNSVFEFLDSHTYAADGIYTVTVETGVPGTHPLSHDIVTTKAVIGLQSIAVTPPNPSVLKGNTQQFTATGTFADSTPRDLTTLVTWASANTAVATISNAVGSQGLATTVAAGTSTISGALPGISGATTLTVTAAAALQSIAVTPVNPSIAKGLTRQFAATGTYSDNTTQVLTAQVTWASATTSVATINATGLATAVGTGTSSISATLSGVTGSTVLTVTAAALQSIAVTPSNPSIAKGTTKQFAATGTYTDNSTQVLTTQATWSAATTSVATINSTGLATAVALGTSSISASLSGITGSTVLTVTAAALQSIAVTPANPSIAKQATQDRKSVG
jgi:trimeric autotransporter adhesin